MMSQKDLREVNTHNQEYEAKIRDLQRALAAARGERPQERTHMDYIIQSKKLEAETLRADLINCLEWLARDLTQEAEKLKSTDRKPNTCVMTTSLVHDIEQKATKLYELEDSVHEMEHAQDHDLGREVKAEEK